MPVGIAPFLSVRGGKQAVEFYQRAFGAREQFRIESPTGDVVARLAVGDAEFWLSDESPEHGNFSPEALEGSTVRMVLTVDDPAAVFARAVAAGATSVHPVVEQHGYLMGRLADPFGHHWEIVKPVEGQG
jgi:PhnB protein